MQEPQALCRQPKSKVKQRTKNVSFEPSIHCTLLFYVISRNKLNAALPVASNENYVAVEYQSSEDNANRIAFINNNGEVIQDMKVDPTGNYLDQPDKWADDNSQFWGELQLGPTPKYIYQITISSWDIKKYDVSQLSIGDEFELNANTGKIIFSDYPVFFDVESKQQFLNSGREVKLFLYDLNSQTIQIIATSITKQFSPKWLDNNSIKYNDPNSETRITYKIN